MTKIDTKKFVMNIGNGAVVGVAVMLLTLILSPHSWILSGKIIFAMALGFTLVGFMEANLFQYLDKKKAFKGDGKWDGGLSIPGAWGSFMFGYGFVVIISAIVSYLI